MHARVQGFIEEGSLKVDENGELSVVDDPSERSEIANEQIRRRKTEINGGAGQINASSLVNGED